MPSRPPLSRSWIWVRQEKPSASTTVSSSACAQPRQQRLLGAGLADLAVAGGEAEVAGQAAAAGVEPLDVDAGPLEQLAVGVPPQDRVLVAVHLGERPRRRTTRAAAPSRRCAR